MDLMVSLCVPGIYSVKLNILVLGGSGGVDMSLNPSGMEMGLELLHRLSKCSFVSSFFFL